VTVTAFEVEMLVLRNAIPAVLFADSVTVADAPGSVCPAKNSLVCNDVESIARKTV